MSIRSAVFGIRSGLEPTLLWICFFLFCFFLLRLSLFAEEFHSFRAEIVQRLLPAGRDPRAMDTRGPVTAQRVPMAAGMPGAVPHGMGPNAPPPARPVKQPQQMFVKAVPCASFVIAAFHFPVL